VFERLLIWSIASGVLWLAGAGLDPDQRWLLWIPALALELAAPVARYWLPGRGRAATADWDVEGGHFAERCQLFIIIALGESIVVTGATASQAGLTSTVVACLVVAFLETVALWWLYFGTPAERSHVVMTTSEDPGRVARDAYTYFHVLIVAGIIATAAAVDLVIAHPHDPQHGIGLAILLGGPALFLVGENLFQWSTTGRANARRLATAALIIALAPLGPEISALALTLIVTAVLTALALWELRAAAPVGPGRRPRTAST
jgi:low temperature requirement protein LtrA